MSKKLAVTVGDVMSWGPCYDREWVEERFGRKRKLTALEILNLRTVKAADKLWAVLREELIPAKTLHLLACDFAERALRRERKAGREPDPRSWAAIEAKRKWVRGEITDDELAAACAAGAAARAVWDAGAAARAAAWAAGEAARAAAWAAWAAGAAARDAAGASARDAAGASAGAAAWAAEYRWQVNHIKRVLNREDAK